MRRGCSSSCTRNAATASGSSAPARHRPRRGRNMKKTTAKVKSPPPEESLERYDWSKATRGRYAGKLKMGTPMRRLDDDLAELFPNSAAVNAALRAIVALGSVLPRKAAGRKSARKAA